MAPGVNLRKGPAALVKSSTAPITTATGDPSPFCSLSANFCLEVPSNTGMADITGFFGRGVRVGVGIGVWYGP